MRRFKLPVLFVLAGVACLGALPASAAAPVVWPSVTLVSYGPAKAGSTAFRRVTFTNRSSLPALLGPVAVSSQGPTGFALWSDTCGGEIVQLAAGASCSYTVMFAPSAAGAFRARLMYASGSSIASVELRGRAG